MLGFDNDFQVQPYQTVLTVANSKFTFYFRTTFVMPTNPAGYRLEGAMWLDDGAVIYLNGVEATRVRMPNGPVAFTTRANNVDNATRETLVIPSGSLVRGTNTRVLVSDCALGGGTTPTETITSLAIEVQGNAAEQQARFLANDPPIVGRIVNDRFTVEVRTLLEDDLPHVARALRQ